MVHHHVFIPRYLEVDILHLNILMEPLTSLITHCTITKLEEWLSLNRMTASPQKSSVTLLTSDRRQFNSHPHVTLNNQQIPLNKTPTILAITYDPHLTFSKHVGNS